MHQLNGRLKYYYVEGLKKNGFFWMIFLSIITNKLLKLKNKAFLWINMKLSSYGWWYVSNMKAAWRFTQLFVFRTMCTVHSIWFVVNSRSKTARFSTFLRNFMISFRSMDQYYVSWMRRYWLEIKVTRNRSSKVFSR